MKKGGRRDKGRGRRAERRVNEEDVRRYVCTYIRYTNILHIAAECHTDALPIHMQVHTVYSTDVLTLTRMHTPTQMSHTSALTWKATD